MDVSNEQCQQVKEAPRTAARDLTICQPKLRNGRRPCELVGVSERCPEGAHRIIQVIVRKLLWSYDEQNRMLCRALTATRCEHRQQLATQQSASYGSQKSQEFIGGYLV